MNTETDAAMKKRMMALQIKDYNPLSERCIDGTISRQFDLNVLVFIRRLETKAHAKLLKNIGH